MKTSILIQFVGFAVTLASVGAFAPRAAAHCDTLGGPVIADAQVALERKDVTPVLKWIRPEAEGEIKEAFTRTLEVRQTGGAAAELADRFFFETLVRVHRAGEGAPFTGLKDDAAAIEPGIEAADDALRSGGIDHVIHDVNNAVAEGIRVRHERVVNAQKHKDESVAKGREFVAAYVDYIHYVEGLYLATMGPAPHGHAPADAHEGESSGL